MRFDLTDVSALPRQHLLVVCLEAQKSAVEQTLKRQSHIDWKRQGLIRVEGLSGRQARDRQYVGGKISSHASQTGGLLHVLTVMPVTNNMALSRELGSFRHARNFRVLVTDYLPRMLEDLELDAVSLASRMLSRVWEHGAIDRSHVIRWLSQFDDFGNNRRIGENLLKVLDFWPSGRLVSALRAPLAELNEIDCVAMSASNVGSSGSTLATRMKKQVESLPSCSAHVRDIADAVCAVEYRSILFVEDCLITGNEMIRVLLGLMGEKDPYGPPKAKVLDDPSKLKSKRIFLKFAVATNWGLIALRKFLEQSRLDNIVVLEPDKLIPVLTPAGETALLEGRLENGDGLIDPVDEFVLLEAFSDTEVWGSDKRALRAVKVCREIGVHLSRDWHARRRKARSEAWIAECGLGVRGLALSLAFSHSVPKSSLLVYWCGGTLVNEGRCIEWEPLFPNA